MRYFSGKIYEKENRRYGNLDPIEPIDSLKPNYNRKGIIRKQVC